MADELDRQFLGTVLDNQTVTGSTWSLVTFSAAQETRDGVLFFVPTSSAANLEVTNLSTDIFAWYSLSPGQTFLVPFPYGSALYVRAAGGASASYKAQEVIL